jgi:hypothetical protein
MALPDALVVADKFHVVALAGRALHEVHGEKRRRGSVAWLLQRGVERLTSAERARVVEALTKEPDLARAWALKEGVRAIYKKPRQEEAAAALESWIGDAQASGTASLPARRDDAPEVAKGGAQLLALPDYERPRRGQAQQSQNTQTEGLRLPKQQELSAKGP